MRRYWVSQLTAPGVIRPLPKIGIFTSACWPISSPKGLWHDSGAYESHLGACKRALFVIDKEGVVAWSYVSPMAINPGADGILDALANSSQSTPT